MRQLLELGADPNENPGDGFPPLFCALGSNHEDREERVALLLDFGADVQQRGVNDYTPLHYAATQDQADCVALLLARGADPQARTRIDHCATPLEEAEFFGHAAGAKALRACTADGGAR
ncbi:MAG: ankyrin repeat domain-containing protein [Betaproteobacteria bacterium]|nr:ankyrin repeat domain-containing protein [Betaproteobacteria bacterium]